MYAASVQSPEGAMPLSFHSASRAASIALAEYPRAAGPSGDAAFADVVGVRGGGSCVPPHATTPKTKMHRERGRRESAIVSISQCPFNWASYRFVPRREIQVISRARACDSILYEHSCTWSSDASSV